MVRLLMSISLLQVQSVGTKKARIKIIGIIKASQEETYLEAEFNNQPHMFVVDSPLLAKTFGFELDEDFEESLLDKIPLSADAEIQGTVSLNSTVYSRIEKVPAVISSLYFYEATSQPCLLLNLWESYSAEGMITLLSL